jgi:hypothetical protein
MARQRPWEPHQRPRSGLWARGPSATCPGHRPVSAGGALRAERALELADDAEALVQQAGKAVEAARDPTGVMLLRPNCRRLWRFKTECSRPSRRRSRCGSGGFRRGCARRLHRCKATRPRLGTRNTGGT